MSEQISVNMENLSQQEREQLISLVEKGNKKKWEGLEPNYVIGGRGILYSKQNVDPTLISDYKKIGFVAGTEKNAKYMLEQLSHYAWMLQAWLEIVGDWRPDWEDSSQNKFAVYYSCNKNRLYVENWNTIKDLHGFYFQTHEQAQKFIEMVGDRIKELGQ